MTKPDLTILTDRQRRVLELRLAGHSWRTIGTALHINEATARVHYRRAIDTLATRKEPTT